MGQIKEIRSFARLQRKANLSYNPKCSWPLRKISNLGPSSIVDDGSVDRTGKIADDFAATKIKSSIKIQIRAQPTITKGCLPVRLDFFY